MREVIARIVDGSDFLEFGAVRPADDLRLCRDRGRTGRHRRQQRPARPDGRTKAAQFIQRCCQPGTPIVYLQNTTGYIVGTEAEKGGMIKHGSKMIQAVSNATVPQITIDSAHRSAPAITACAVAPTIRASCSPGRTAGPP